MDKSTRRAKFEGVWNVIHDELLAHLKACGMPAEAQEWYSEVGLRKTILCIFASDRSIRICITMFPVES